MRSSLTGGRGWRQYGRLVSDAPSDLVSRGQAIFERLRAQPQAPVEPSPPPPTEPEAEDVEDPVDDPVEDVTVVEDVVPVIEDAPATPAEVDGPVDAAEPVVDASPEPEPEPEPDVADAVEAVPPPAPTEPDPRRF